MPIVLLFLLAFATGVATALLGREELRLSSRAAWLSNSFQEFSFFLVLLLVPVTAYFYVFHGDWSVMYWFDTKTIPSAVALTGFVVQIGIGFAGFLISVSFVRNQRDLYAVSSLGASVLAMILVVLFGWSRLSHVGTFEQFHGDFGLAHYTQGAIFQGTLVMGVLLVVGMGYLFVSLALRARRAIG